MKNDITVVPQSNGKFSVLINKTAYRKEFPTASTAFNAAKKKVAQKRNSYQKTKGLK